MQSPSSEHSLVKGSRPEAVVSGWTRGPPAGAGCTAIVLGPGRPAQVEIKTRMSRGSFIFLLALGEESVPTWVDVLCDSHHFLCGFSPIKPVNNDVCYKDSLN